MINFRKGERFPLEKYLNLGEVTIPILNEGFFDVVAVLGNITPGEYTDWTKGALKIYLYEAMNIPFIIFKFDKWSFDISINLLKLVPVRQKQWLSADANTISMYLVEQTTGILKGIRFVSIKGEDRRLITDILSEQIKSGAGSNEIDFKINTVQNAMPTQEMIKASIKRLF